MRNRLLLVVALAALAGPALAAGGKVYRWTDPQGRVHYSDAPGDGAHNVQEVNVKLGAATQAVAAPDANAPEAVAARRAEQCTAKKEQLSSYQTAVRLIERDSLGREREFTPDEREKLVAKTQSEIGSLCDEPPG